VRSSFRRDVHGHTHLSWLSFPVKRLSLSRALYKFYTRLCRADYIQCETNAHILERRAIMCLATALNAITYSVFKRIKGKEFLIFHVF
jgi:hypothetical protein